MFSRAMRITTAVVGVCAWLGPAPVEAASGPRVVGVQLGVASRYKIGSWAPVLVRVDARPEGFSGGMLL